MMQKIDEKAPLDDKTLLLFEGNLKRIFALNVTKSTFRELQNVILNCCNQDKNLANRLFEMLLTGNVPPDMGNDEQKEILIDIVKHFTIPSRLAKEIYERGDFINIVTSDGVAQKEHFAFINRIRRIDGGEFTFMSDTESTLHLIQHFVHRLSELEKAPKAKELLEKYKSQLLQLSEKIKLLVK